MARPAGSKNKVKTAEMEGLDILMNDDLNEPTESEPVATQKGLPLRDQLIQFNTMASMASAAKQEWIETSKEVIDYFNPNGLGGKDYFIFNGVKVRETGSSPKVLADQHMDLTAQAYGKDAGKLLK